MPLRIVILLCWLAGSRAIRADEYEFAPEFVVEAEPRVAFNWPFTAREDRSPPTPPPPAVARIIVPNGDSIAYGSGTLIDVYEKYGLVVTNWHVVDGATGEINVQFPDGFRSGAKVLKTDKDWDLAALAIWRPRCAAIPISNNAPQPGEPLTIGGYGSGQFRFAVGQCVQYGAPSVRHPAEIVEVSATARQGDSGGPILNQRGEVAGVLFGTGGGVTSGSYCGRVKLFLASVMPPRDGAANAAAKPIAVTDKPAVANGAPINAPSPAPFSPAPPPANASVNNPIQPSPLAAAPRSQPFPTPSTTAGNVMLPVSPANPAPTDPPATVTSRTDAFQSPYNSFQPRPATNTSVSVAPSDDFNWERFAGHTPLEQGKTVLAGIGVLFVVGRIFRWLKS